MRVRVSIQYEVSGYVEVEAKSEEDAEAKVSDKLDEDGVDSLENFTSTNRTFYVLDSEAIKA